MDMRIRFKVYNESNMNTSGWGKVAQQTYHAVVRLFNKLILPKYFYGRYFIEDRNRGNKKNQFVALPLR